MMEKKVFVLAFILVMLSGCVPIKEEVPPVGIPSSEDLAKAEYCNADVECICGGIDKFSGKCFIGNIAYYDRYVDSSKQCPDFCSGIAGNLEVKCVDNKCIQTVGCISDVDCRKGESCNRGKCVSPSSSKPLFGECKADSDCSKQGCSGQLCRSASAEPIMTTCEYRPEYDCIKMIDCGCVDGRCAWSKNAEYEKCVEEARNSVPLDPIV